MFARGLRAETRSKTKEDLRKVHKFHEQVRCWEKKWVAVKDTSMLVYKWVPSIVVDVGHTKKGAYNRQTNLTASHAPTTGLLSSYSRQKSPTEHANAPELTESNLTKPATQPDFELKLSEDAPSSVSNDSCTVASSEAPVNPSDRIAEDVHSDVSSKPVSPTERKPDSNEVETPNPNPVQVKQCDEPSVEPMETA